MSNSIVRGVIFGLLSWLLPLLMTFVVTPFVVAGLGAKQFGLYTLVLGFVSYGFVFGIGRAVTKYVAEYRATNDAELIGEVYAATLFLNFLVGAAGAAILFFAAEFFVEKVILIDAELKSAAVTAFHLAAAAIFVLTLQNVPSAVLPAVGRFDWLASLTTFFVILLGGGNLILIYQGGDAVTLLSWNLLVTAVNAGTFFWAACRFLPEARGVWTFSGAVFRRVAWFSAGVVGYQLPANVFLLFERSYITRTLGTEDLTFYSLPMNIAIYVHVFISSLTLMLMPLTSGVGATDDTERLISIYQRASKYVALLIAFIVAALCVGSWNFLNLWLGAEFAEKSAVPMIFHVLTFSAMAFGIVAWHLSEGLGFPVRNAMLVVFWLISGVGLMLWLTPEYGLNGAAAARAAGVVFSTPIFIVVIEKLSFGRIFFGFWLKILSVLILAAMLGGTAEFFLLKVLPLNYFGWLGAIFVAGLIYLGFLFAAGFFTIEERRWLMTFAGRARN